MKPDTGCGIPFVLCVPISLLKTTEILKLASISDYINYRVSKPVKSAEDLMTNCRQT